MDQGDDKRGFPLDVAPELLYKRQEYDHQAVWQA
jgi:hypothetical protein